MSQSDLDQVASIPANNSKLLTLGRVQEQADGALRMAYPGVALRFKYAGAPPVLLLEAASETCFFNLSINGWQSALLHLKKGLNRISLPTGRAPASGWMVELVRRTEAWQGTVDFRGLTWDAEQGRLLEPPPFSSRRLLVIGDSITTGHYVEQLPGQGDASPRTNNAERTWGWLLARRLDAVVNIVAYGGRGLIRSWDGSTEAAAAPMFFERALPDEPTSRWEHERYQPDVVVVMLGQNDFSTGIIAREEFVSTYHRFLQRIRSVHPGAGLLLTGSPMHGTWSGSEDALKRDALYDYLRETVARFKQGGGDRAKVVEVSHQPGTSLNAHPVVFQMEQIAAELEPAVRELTGWE